MRYYSTQRPLMPGGFPKPQGNKVTEVHNFDNRQYVDEIEREAWGWIEYEKAISAYDAHSYELVAVPTKNLHLKYIGADSWGRHVYEDENGKLWKHTDCLCPKEVCQNRGDILYSSSGNTFDGEPDCPMRADIKAIFEEV